VALHRHSTKKKGRLNFLLLRIIPGGFCMKEVVTIDRRRLLALAGYGMVATSLSWLAGCGGGGGGGGDAGGGGSGGGSGSTGFEGNGAPAAGTAGTAVSPAQRVAALDAVAAAIAPLAGAGLRFDSVALAQLLQAMTAFQRVGISSTQQNVWALFTDGRSLVVPNNLDPVAGVAPLAALRPAPAGIKRRALAAPEDLLPALLTQAQYRQLDMFGQVPVSSAVDAAHLCLDFVSQETLPNLRRMAVGRGFVLPESQQLLPPDQGYDNGVDGLRSFSGDGVFFITACSAEVGADSARATVICVDTPATEANEAKYQADLSAGMLTYAVAMRGVDQQWVPNKCLAITPGFAVANWSFPVESVGILNLSGGSPLADWAGVLRSCGLRNILTWDKPVSWRRMLAFADDLMQLLLATNNMDGNFVRQAIEPRLRSYGVGETLGYLVGKHLTDDAAGASQAVYLPETFPPLFVNTLLPTISYVNIDEGRAVIELNGQFGDKQLGAPSEARYGSSLGGQFAEPLLNRAADPAVAAAGVLSNPLWNGDLIQSDTELQALMRGGYIQVFNGGRWSNAVQITHWEIPMHVVSTITGGLTLDVTVTLHLRADVRGHRMAPDGQRGNTRILIALSTTLESNATYTASGEISRTTVSIDPVTTTITWNGGGAVGNTLGLIQVAAGGFLNWETKRMTFTLAVQGGSTYDQRTLVTHASGTLSDTTDPKPVSVAAVFSTAGPLELVFSDTWDLQAGNVELLSEPVDLLGPRTRTTVLSWTAVTPQFAPEATVGGV
jgi:hypothetical protein